MTRYSDEMPGEMKSKQNQENNKTPKTKPPLYKAVFFFFFSAEKQTNKKILPPKPPVREAEATWGREGGGQGL